MLTDREISKLRSDIESWFDLTCSIFKRVGVDDAYGGRTSGHATEATYTAVPCMVESGGGQDQERLTLAGITEVQLFTVTMPAETDVEVGDHVVISTGQHLNVRAVMAPESYEFERRVVTTEVGPTAPHT